MRKANMGDVPGILVMIEEARSRIRSLGIDQWSGGYPNECDFASDIARESCWVSEDEQGINGIVSVTIGPEEVYREMDGEWLTNGTLYGTIHRMAVADRVAGKGVAVELEKLAVELCRKAGARSVRSDTHLGNVVMQKFFEHHGYRPCGIIILTHLPAGDPRRRTFEKLL